MEGEIMSLDTQVNPLREGVKTSEVSIGGGPLAAYIGLLITKQVEWVPEYSPWIVGALTIFGVALIICRTMLKIEALRAASRTRRDA